MHQLVLNRIILNMGNGYRNINLTSIKNVNIRLNTFLIKIFVFIIILSTIDGINAIQCFKCSVSEERQHIRNETYIIRACSKFDESEDYYVDCPYSTMCLKTISVLFLQNGHKQETITRGCAQQKDTTQVFRNRQWQQEHSVQEVYKEGCEEFKDNNLVGIVKTHCYCRGSLCNKTIPIKLTSMLYFNAITVIFLFNVFIRKIFII